MTKQRTLLFIFILLILIIVGISSYLFYKKPNTTTTPSTRSLPTAPSSSKNLKSIFYTGRAQKCIAQEANGITETYYMSGNTVHGEFSSSGTQTINLLADGSLVYIWVGSQTKGSSMPESDTNTINSVMQADGISEFNSNAKRNLQCISWTANPSVLGAPYAVVFTPVNK